MASEKLQFTITMPALDSKEECSYNLEINMGNVTVIIVIDKDPHIDDLVEVSLWTAGKGVMVRQTSFKDLKVGEAIKWTNLENVWYDFYLMDNQGRYKYGLKGKYCTQTNIVKLTQIINGNARPSAS